MGFGDRLSKWWDEAVLGETDDKGKKPAPVAMANEIAVTYGIHNILKYDLYDEDTRLFYNDNSIGFCLEVLPQTGADDQLVNRLNTLFTPIPPGYGIQWTMFSHTILDDVFESYIDLRQKAFDKDESPEIGLEIARRRVRHVLKTKGRPVFKNSFYVIKKPTLILSITKLGSYTDSRLVKQMQDLAEMLGASLKSAGMPSIMMNANALLRFLWPIFNPETMFSKDPIEKIDYDGMRSIKEQVTKFGHHAIVKPKHLIFGTEPEDGAEDTRVAVRTFGIQRYPQYKQLYEMNEVIGALFDDGLQYPCPFMITQGVFTLDPNQAEAVAQIKAARSLQNATSKMANFQPELKDIAQDWKAVSEHINNGGTMCEVYHTVTIFSPLAEVDRASQNVVNIWRNSKFSVARLDVLQLASLYAALPMTLTENARDDLKQLRIMGTKTTINAVDMAPIIAEWQGIGRPVVMMFGRRGTPTFIDFYANKQGNYNLYVCGVSGAGKSVALQEIISAYGSIGAQAFIIDVGRSYRNYVSLRQGVTFDFQIESDICLNPFSWLEVVDQEEKEGRNTFKQELRLLKPMFAKMASPKQPLDSYQLALMEIAITDAWNIYRNDCGVDQVQEMLMRQVDERGEVDQVAFRLARQLQPFSTGGVYGGYFNGEANVNFDNDLVYLELEELKDAPELRSVVLFAVTARIMKEMYLSRTRPKICLIDEGWQLLDDDDNSAAFIEEGYRRARKYRGIFALGTQGIDDAFKNAAAQAAYTNADWKIYLRQSDETMAYLEKGGKVNFSEVVMAQIRSLRTEGGQYSEMMIVSPNGSQIVRHVADPFSLVMASTNADDYVECEQLLESGHSTIEAINIMLERRGHLNV